MRLIYTSTHLGMDGKDPEPGLYSSQEFTRCLSCMIWQTHLDWQTSRTRNVSIVILACETRDNHVTTRSHWCFCAYPLLSSAEHQDTSSVAIHLCAPSAELGIKDNCSGPSGRHGQTLGSHDARGLNPSHQPRHPRLVLLPRSWRCLVILWHCCFKFKPFLGGFWSIEINKNT